MIDEETGAGVEEVLAGLRPSFAANGADLSMVAITPEGDGEGAVVELALSFGPDACEECVMPHDIIAGLVLAAIRKRLPHVRRVALDDPRLP